MEISFLGTGSAYPTPVRGASCIIMRNEGVYWMFDCGEGSQIQLMKSPIRPGKISRIFITHLHGDHVFGLPGLLCTISQNFTGSCKPVVHLYGPQGLRRFLRVSLGLSRSQLGFRYSVHELKPLPEQFPNDWESWGVGSDCEGPLHPNEDMGTTLDADSNQTWQVCDEDGMFVKAGILVHRIPSFGYVVEEHSKPGTLDVCKLKADGVPPGPLYSKIKNGDSVTFEDGRIIHPNDYIGAAKPGRKFAILQDSRDSSKMATLCEDADVLVHEATLPNEMQENAVEKGHSTPEMAGAFAQSVNARHLVLTHLSQRFRPLSAEMKAGDLSVEIIGQQAREAFSAGIVTVAEDFTIVTIPLVK